MAALVASLVAIPLWGQRGGRGGMAMGGARGGYATHGSGFVGASRGGYWGSGHIFPGHYPYYPRRYPYYYRWRYPWGFRGYGAFPWSWGWSGVGWLGPGDDTFPAQSYPMDASTPADNSSAFFAYTPNYPHPRRQTQRRSRRKSAPARSWYLGIITAKKSRTTRLLTGRYGCSISNGPVKFPSRN